MGKKKRGHPDIEEILARPWCYYCERDFDDQKVLINHQKAKHFKCERCGRRLNTAGGLSVHMTQVHKETLTTIENALPNRSNLDVEIFGMEGIPQDVVNSHNQRVVTQFAQAEAERRAATGNPGPGGVGGSAAKKPKLEDTSDLKKRLAEHKAKKTAEQAVGISNGDATPNGTGHRSQSPALGPGQSPGYAGSPPYPQQQMPYGGPPNSTYASYPQQYGPPVGGPYQQQPPFAQQPSFPQQSPGYGSPGPQFPGPQFPGPQAFGPPQQYSPPINQNFAPPQYQNGPPRGYGAGSPPMPYHPQGQHQPSRTQTPPQSGPPPQRSGSLPSAPGLPQRPSFAAPSVNAFQMHQLHQGQLPAPPNPNAYSNPPNNGQQTTNGLNTSQNGRGPQPPQANYGSGMQGIDQSHTQQNSSGPFGLPPSMKDVGTGPNKEATKMEQLSSEKKGKKDKERITRMVLTDDKISPEEKMAQLPRYAYVPDGKGETVLGDATTPAVAGVVDDQAAS